MAPGRVASMLRRCLKTWAHCDLLGLEKKEEKAVAHAGGIVAGWKSAAKEMVKGWLAEEPGESLQRLDGIQSLVDEVVEVVEDACFEAVSELLGVRAEAAAGRCRTCGLRCERERKVVRVRTRRRPVQMEVWRYRCRTCRTNRSPVREWLGLKAGMTTGGLDRALTALSTELSFGQAAAQMLEQHGHEVDRTLVERRTYAVGQDAVEYLQERRATRKDAFVNAPGRQGGTPQVLVQVDSGAVPVGKLERPPKDDNDKTQERTPVRGLVRGRRPKAKREVRVALAWQPGQMDDKIVDVHVAPHGHPEVTGDRMYCAALEAGMGASTHVHGTFDMAQWQVLQFQEQFGAQPEYSICADFFHAMEYVAGAAKGCQSDPALVPTWLAKQKQRLMQGERDAILRDLDAHECKAGSCPQTDQSECAVVAARRYLRRNGRYMDYPRYRAAQLPIGSGEVEGRIRHIVRRRLDIPGDWREENLALITALITVRQSGWWDDFWEWRDQRDRQRFRQRLRGIGLNRFYGRPKAHRLSGAASTYASNDSFSPTQGTSMI